MLWRKDYVTPISRNVALTVDFGAEVRILLALISLDSLTEVMLWLRLIEADLPSVPHNLILVGALSPAELESVLAPSRHSSILVEPELVCSADQKNRAVAMVVRGSVARVQMFGPPTEDAWDEFQLAANGES